MICPTCKKPVASGACPRCGCELDEAIRVEQTALTLARKAASLLMANQAAPALVLAQQAWELRRQDLAAKVACLAACHAGQYDLAAVWYGRALNMVSAAGAVNATNNLHQ